MALDTPELSLWDVGFRWAGLDPDALWIRLPLEVRDNFRLIMRAIVNGEIICGTLCLDKRPSGSKSDPRFYIRTHLDQVYACMNGQTYDRKLLRWATLDREDFLLWCTYRGITPPGFWFPPGWKSGYEHPEGLLPGLIVRHEEPDTEGTQVSFRYDWPSIDEVPADEPTSQADEATEDRLRHHQITRIACQQIAAAIWKSNPTRTIASVVRDELIQKYGGAAHYEDATVREWIKVVAPSEVRNRRGRPRKNGGTDENPTP